MKRICLLFFLLAIVGCAPRAHIAKPVAIQVSVHSLAAAPKTIQLNEEQSKNLLRALSEGREEWAIFVPDYDVVLHYKDSAEEVAIGSQHFRIGSGTYRTDENLDALIAPMLR